MIRLKQKKEAAEKAADDAAAAAAAGSSSSGAVAMSGSESRAPDSGTSGILRNLGVDKCR